jgi:excisionase family DNA binding protein
MRPPEAPPEQPVTIETPWLTAEEAAAYLKLPTVKALYQLVRRGIVPARRLGLRTMRFTREELDEALRAPRR